MNNRALQLISVLLLLIMTAIIWWHSYTTRAIIERDLRSDNIDALVDSGRYVIYLDLLHMLESGDLTQTKEMIQLLIEGEKQHIEANIFADHIDSETKEKLAKRLKYVPCETEN